LKALDKEMQKNSRVKDSMYGADKIKAIDKENKLLLAQSEIYQKALGEAQLE
jgi:hypothetical protein